MDYKILNIRSHFCCWRRRYPAGVAMFYSYLFDGDPENLDGLSSDKCFLLLSQRGILKSLQKDVPLMPTVKSHLQRGVIHGDKYSGVHFFFNSAVLLAGRENVQVLHEKLIDEVKPGCSTYACLLAARRVIIDHFEEAISEAGSSTIATLIDRVDDCDHVANVAVFTRITDNYAVLSKFNPRYRKHEEEWQQKTESYRAVFCRKPEPVNVTLR
ncbi:MAG: hypothetical protein KME38_08985 [Spirirestis rafaelensis WJT71-NPBG6]|jgi:hypothetical protein|nr:hypothetical protein [Spirirestis rafaelensis WJT71-NPBG6]